MNYKYSILCVKMLPSSAGYWLAIGAACGISSIYFYCTYRGQRCYYENDVSEINRTRINDGDGV